MAIDPRQRSNRIDWQVPAVLCVALMLGSRTSKAARLPDVDADAIQRTPPAYVMLNMYVTLDQVAVGESAHIGDVDHMRVVYDANTIDPFTKRVRILNLQHYIGGVFNPPHPDAALMPMDDAWLDLSSLPYRLHYRAAVTHGKPILIEVDETARRLSIRSQQQPEMVLIGGPYAFDPTPITGPEAFSAATR